MNKLLTRVIATLVIAASTVLPAAAGPIKFGPKVGVSMNSFSMSEKAFSSDNRTGFTGGLMAEFTVPIIGIGVDLSAMYVRRTSTIGDADESANVVLNFIDVPLHLKYKIGLPVVGNFLSPFVFTGPDFAFNLSKHKNIFEDYSKKNFDVIWDFGIGLEFFSHLQVAASYGLGVNKAVSLVGVNGSGVTGRTNCWTVTAAYLF